MSVYNSLYVLCKSCYTMIVWQSCKYLFGRLKRRWIWSMDWPIVGWGPGAHDLHALHSQLRSAHTEGVTEEVKEKHESCPRRSKQMLFLGCFQALLALVDFCLFKRRAWGPELKQPLVLHCCIGIFLDCNGALNDYPDIKPLPKVSPCSALHRNAAGTRGYVV